MGKGEKLEKCSIRRLACMLSEEYIKKHCLAIAITRYSLVLQARGEEVFRSGL